MATPMIAEASAVAGRRRDEHRVASGPCDSIQLTHRQARVAQGNMRGGNQPVLVRRADFQCPRVVRESASASAFLLAVRPGRAIRTPSVRFMLHLTHRIPSIGPANKEHRRDSKQSRTQANNFLQHGCFYSGLNSAPNSCRIPPRL